MKGTSGEPAPTLEALRERAPAAEALLEALVNEASGSHHRDGVARAVGRVAEALAALGADVTLHRDEGRPRHLTARVQGRGASRETRAAALLVGHADTVFPPSDTRPFAVEGEGAEARLRGPGIADMKGGLVVAIEALAAVLPALRESDRAIELLVNGDEELGSPHSRDLVRERSRAARAVLVYENCDEEGAVIVGRKGLGRATIRITGRGAHAGIAPERGRSAVIEMARQVLEISRLDAPARGLGVIVGTARGGLSRNTVPPAAEIEIDLRYLRKADGESALRSIREIAAGPSMVPDVTSVCEGELHRPPMPAESAAGPLFPCACEAARALASATGRGGPGPAGAGGVLRGLATGGGSDANLAADEGTPVLDGLGVVGSDIHTPAEWCLRRSLVERAALSALILRSLIAGGEREGSR